MSTGPEFEKVLLERRSDGVRVLTLNDPERRNAIGPEMRDELLEVAKHLTADKTARCLVITGTGRAFCAGADLMDIFDVHGATPATVRARQLAYYDSFLWLRDLPYPTVAAINGHAIGAGLNLALVCDITVAGPNARFGATFARLGLHPGGGCTYFLTRRLGPGRALRTLLRGQTLDGQEAFAQGVADEFVDDPREFALTLATTTAALEPSLVQDMKRTVETATDGSFTATMNFESWAQTASAFNEGVQDGIQATGRSTTRSRSDKEAR